MNHLEFYKDIYLKELERKEQLTNSSLSTPITTLTGLVAATYYFLTSFDFTLGISSFVFGGTAGLSLSCIMFSMFYLIRSYIGFGSDNYGYLHLPLPKKLADYYEQIKTAAGGNTQLADTLFENYLQGKYIDYNERNVQNNDLKAHYLYVAKKWLLSALVAVVAMTVLFGYNYFTKRKKDETYNVRIVATSTQSKPTFIPSSMPENSSNETPQAPQTPQHVVMPTAPADRLILESEKPTITLPAPEPKPKPGN